MKVKDISVLVEYFGELLAKIRKRIFTIFLRKRERIFVKY
jgi:hypothetical protein